MPNVSSLLLDRDDEGRLYHEGAPFTGTEEWRYSTGVIGTSTPYVDGIPHGVQEGWYEDGTKRSETPYREGCVRGIAKNWHPNGKPQSEEEIAGGKRLWSRAWNEKGEPLVIP